MSVARPDAQFTDAEMAAALPVREGEDAWTVEEVAELREELLHDMDRLHKSIQQAEADLAELLSERNEAGRDAADVGTANFERDQGMSMAANLKEMLAECEQALARMSKGTIGSCESCGEPVGKWRLLAFPRARLCVTCKQREERH